MASEQLERLITALRKQPFVQGDPVESRRAAFEQAASRAKLPDDVTVTPIDVAGRPAESLEPADGQLDRAILHLHGGGYCIGSPGTHRALGTWMAKATRTRVVMLDYRLAPEHPHPAALEDAVAAYRWLVDDDGVPAEGIAISGDSAGGGLTVATLVALRDHDLPLPGAGVAISPWSDLSLPGDSLDSNADVDPQVQRWLLEEMAAWTLGDQDPRTPTASPRYADLSDLPPLLIHVGGAETLLDDARDLAAAVKEAGGDVTLEVWEDMLHVWHAFAPILPEATQGLERIAAWLDYELS